VAGPVGNALPSLGDPAPAIRLREELAAARTVGVSFSEAWPAAVEVALGTVSAPKEHRSWETVIASTRDAWESAYDREDALAGHQAVGMLAEAA
jgi:hypothetical protein